MKKTITIQKLSSLTLLKLLLLGGAVFWILYLLGSFFYLLFVGDLYLPYSMSGAEEVTTLATGVKVFLSLAILVAFMDFLFLLGFWLIATLGLWLYSKFRPITISYYESDAET